MQEILINYNNLSNKTNIQLKKEDLLWIDADLPFSIMIVNETGIKDFNIFIQEIERIILSLALVSLILNDFHYYKNTPQRLCS